ncbi:MAG TPA: dihydrodipicolinate reductase C-terminal domain-containing protein [Terriglobales bacterium]|nr:dihydrodipicolinate reductase C-terminal domain-containing protein [Terriglobales bacterium]
MNLLLLGHGKTGSLVAEVARQRKHEVRVLCTPENPHASALTPDNLRNTDVVIDFTTPHAVLENIRACVQAAKNMVVGTTGWYGELPNIREAVERGGSGFLFGANFSIGVNLFFDVARASATALQHGYYGQIFERHHVHKKDAPSGTAVAIQKEVQQASGSELEIISFREGDVVGMHELVYDSPNDSIYLCHDAKSRRGFAEGAVRAAEWLAGKKGFYDFKDIWRQL